MTYEITGTEEAFGGGLDPTDYSLTPTPIADDVSRETYEIDTAPCDIVAALDRLTKAVEAQTVRLNSQAEGINILGQMFNQFGEMNAKLYQVLGGVGEAFGELSAMDKIKLVKDLMSNG